jgi:hypothetical protein
MSEVESGYYEKRRREEEERQAQRTAWLQGLRVGSRVALPADARWAYRMPFDVFEVVGVTRTLLRLKTVDGGAQREFDRSTGRPRPRNSSYSMIEPYTQQTENANARWAMIQRLGALRREDWAELPDETLQKIIGALNVNPQPRST